MAVANAVPGATMTVGRKVSTTDFVLLDVDEYLRNNSGRFLVEAAGVWQLATSAATQLDGWSHDAFQISTAGGNTGKTPYPQATTFATGTVYTTITRDIHQDDTIFYIPVFSSETIVLGNVGLKCDLALDGSGSSRCQTVRPSVTTNKVVQIVDVDTINNYAYVKAIL